MAGGSVIPPSDLSEAIAELKNLGEALVREAWVEPSTVVLRKVLWATLVGGLIINILREDGLETHETAGE